MFLFLLSLSSFSVFAYGNQAVPNKILAAPTAPAAKDGHELAFNFKVVNIFQNVRLVYENLADAGEPAIGQQSSLANSSRQNDLSKLTALRVALKMYFSESGSWPDKAWLKGELQSVLLTQGASSKLWAIKNYWKTSASFYLLLSNPANGATVKMKGNKAGGVSWE